MTAHEHQPRDDNDNVDRSKINYSMKTLDVKNNVSEDGASKSSISTATSSIRSKEKKDTSRDDYWKGNLPKPDVSLPGSASKAQSPADHQLNYVIRPPAEFDLNTVGIPVSNTVLPHHYLYPPHPVSATNHYITAFDPALSPSTYPTMLVGCPMQPTHAIVFENSNRRNPQLQPISHPLFLTPNSSKSRTKHLKPPSNNKLKSKPVKMNQPGYAVQSTSQSCMFYPASDYALPGTSQPQVTSPHSNQKQKSFIPTSQYSNGRRDQRSNNDERYAIPPTAPTLYEEEPSPLCSNGIPPAYATIDPKKLRTRHLRPPVFKKKGLVSNRRYQQL